MHALYAVIFYFLMKSSVFAIAESGVLPNHP